MSYSPIFDAMVEGMESVVQKDNYKLKVITFYEKRDNLEHYLGDLRTTDCVGIILFGTEMREEMVRPFLKLPFPVVILDAYFENLDCNYVVPNNRQGAYLATDYLISRRMKQPGYLQSAYPLRNFSERLEGFYHAARKTSWVSFSSLASVYRMAAAPSPSMEPKFPWPSTRVLPFLKSCAITTSAS